MTFFIFVFRNCKGVIKNLVRTNCRAKIDKPFTRLRCSKHFSVYRLKRNFSDEQIVFSHISKTAFEAKFFRVCFASMMLRRNQIEQHKKTQHLFWNVGKRKYVVPFGDFQQHQKRFLKKKFGKRRHSGEKVHSWTEDFHSKVFSIPQKSVC